MIRQSSIFIVGPCAAESEEQILAVARSLRAGEVLRAGVWKPRTNPHSFQGAGIEALTWLAEAKRQTRCATATEVATAEHVQAAIAAGVDYLWIGARTSANPIAVQEIADAVSSLMVNAQCSMVNGKWSMVNAPQACLIKNPVNEDTALWLGNIARLEAAGVPVMAIHRGCGHRPCWQMAYDLRQQRPDIPLLLDPSHLSGQAEAIPELCRKAMSELGLDGLMVEVHPTPEKALSDSRQQITPTDWRQIAESLPAPSGEHDPLPWLRAIIDEVDDELWNTLLRRQDVSRRIGIIKHESGLEIVQPERWQQVLDRRQQWAEAHGLNTEDTLAIMEAIHRLSVGVQTTDETAKRLNG